MKDAIRIESVSASSCDMYIEVGRTSYAQHYNHLWQQGDPSVYLEKNFARKALLREIADSNALFFIVYDGPIAVGILKIQKNANLGPYRADEAMLLDKIYILKQYSGKGIGIKVLDFAVEFGKTHNKKLIWLEAMQKGPALQFYFKNGFKIHAEIQHPSPEVVADQKAMYILIRMLETG
ncbi:MAG: GNAT family N-acetyltransferase [Maribacter sp.]|nr:GNAT family N-acetyltransferase [Maribacter sp.]